MPEATGRLTPAERVLALSEIINGVPVPKGGSANAKEAAILSSTNESPATVRSSMEDAFALQGILALPFVASVFPLHDENANRDILDMQVSVHTDAVKLSRLL